MKKTILSLLSITLLAGCGLNTSNGTGEKIGQVVKLSKVGMFSKTWEAQLIRGGMSGGSGSFGTVPFDFTVESEKDADKLRGYLESQTEVLLQYRTEGLYSLFRTEGGGHFMVSIEPTKAK